MKLLISAVVAGVALAAALLGLDLPRTERLAG